MYNSYYLQVYSYVMTIVKNRHQAEEITQNTFYKAMTAKKAYAGKSSELTWLCSIARNLAMDECRKNTKFTELDEEQLSSWYAELPENSSRFHAAAGVLKLLSKDGRSIPYVLSTGTVSADETHWTGGYQIHAVYDTPVLPEDVQQLQVFGQVISLP